ncbi:MAG: aminotransferase class I/II-fold pyridoxal phosphate-dependent enzyme [Hyphomicrobiales bacterium]
MIPLAVPDLSGNESRYLQQCIDTTFVSSVGRFVDDFESAVAQVAGTTGAVATSSGTTALHLALAALRVGRGDLVVLPSYTFIASANAISMAGARPWLIDISQETWTLDPSALRAALEQDTISQDGSYVHRQTGERVAAIMPVHTLGHPADMDAIGDVARDYQLPVVADSAAALGALYKQRPIGQLATVSCLSFNGNKTITSGGGGMVLSNERGILERAEHLNTTARVGSAYLHDEAAFNYRMTNVQAAVGLAQVERLEIFLAAKARISQRYSSELFDLPGLTLFPNADWAQSAHWFSGIVIDEPAKLSGLVAALNKVGIQAREFWIPMHSQTPYRDCPIFGDLNVSSDIAQRILTLPCSTNLTDDDQGFVISQIRELW